MMLRTVVFIGQHVFDVFQHLGSKICGVHPLDSVIGFPEHLDNAENAFRNPDAKKLWSAQPRLRYRPPGTHRLRKECISTPRRKKLRSARPRLRHRLPRTPRPPKECPPTPRRKKIRSAPPRYHHRLPGSPGPRISSALRSKRYIKIYMLHLLKRNFK